MKMKHWAYIGLALIVANAALLGGVRAAELSPNPFILRSPSFAFWRSRLEAPWRKPQKLASPVTVRLFSESGVGMIWLKNTTGFVFSGQVVQSPALVTVKDGRMEVSQNEHPVLVADQLTINSMDDNPFELKTRHGSHRWTRGEVRMRVVRGKLEIVNQLNLEDYVSGILEGELGHQGITTEVLKAQLVVARTYVLSMRGNRNHNQGYEFCDGPHCQVFSGVPHTDDPMMQVALASVRGQYLSHNGHPIAAFYHHDCGGMTTAVEDVWPTSPEPYLVPVSEGPESVCRLSPKYAWKYGESRRSWAACFRRYHWLDPQEALDTIKVVRTDSSGRATTIMIQGNRTLLIPVGKFRNAVNQYYGREVLRSSLFTITRINDRFVFKGRGWGHGVGLCQEGAKFMSRHGKTYKEILDHYFPHTKLKHLS